METNKVDKTTGRRTIRVSEEVYNEIFDMGVNWSTTFNDVLEDVIKQAKANGKSSAAAAKED